MAPYSSKSIVSCNGCCLTAPRHNMNQCWRFVNWSCENRFQWTYNQNKHILVKKMKLNLLCKLLVVLFRSKWIDKSMLTPLFVKQLVLVNNKVEHCITNHLRGAFILDRWVPQTNIIWCGVYLMLLCVSSRCLENQPYHLLPSAGTVSEKVNINKIVIWTITKYIHP